MLPPMTIPKLVIRAALAAAAAGCAAPGGDYGATHSERLTRAPEAAAHCFARNAEEHSGALVAKVTRTRDGAHALVQVRNGVIYASADFRPAGAGSIASITLMATTASGQRDLLAMLVKGC